jgi:formate/nitrite transporter FocA (FNT family)
VTAVTSPTLAADGTLVSTAAIAYGSGRLLTRLAFSVGIIVVIIAGAELFTGKNLTDAISSSARDDYRIGEQLRRREPF